MDPNTKILIIILCMAAIFSGITYLAVKRAGNTESDKVGLKKVSIGLGYAQSIAAAISPFLPKISGETISKVLGVAQQAVSRVEATYKAASVTGSAACDTRTTEAISLIKSALALDGIEDTAEIDKLINTVIPLLVLALPKTHNSITEPAGNIVAGSEQ